MSTEELFSTIGVPRETAPGERRVALAPVAVPPLTKAGFQVLVETGAGEAAGFTDSAYESKGARLVGSRAEAFGADVLLQVRVTGTWGDGTEDADLLHPGQVVIGMCRPLAAPFRMKPLADLGVTVFALELMPRITRAQNMDVLSSQAMVAGYKAVLLAAEATPKMFPLLTTAAGTIAPARVLVIGAG